jgi:hypothetical protein
MIPADPVPAPVNDSLAIITTGCTTVFTGIGEKTTTIIF